MRRSHRLSCALLLVAAMALGATSCGGGGSGGSNPDLVLLGFNVPNIAGIPLNQPLMFTFSADIDPSSITPDTLRVVGALGPNFESTVVDGNLVALLPRSPNFENYSDAGLLPDVEYTVSFAQYPAPSTIRTPDGKPLLDAESFQFKTVPVPEFIEPRRPIRHGLPPSAGGVSDDEGCLDNSDNSLENTKQFGSGAGARLLCLKNEGAPQVILDECDPTHNDRSVGNPSAVTPGFVNLPALRVRFNEPLDPVTVVPYVPTEKLGLNVQLWLVGDTDRVPLPPSQVRTNKPLIVQSLTQTEIILVAANEDGEGTPVGGVQQGTYMINATGGLSDLPGNGLDTASRPNPAIGGFQDVEDAVNASGDVPPGYRFYFVTLVVPGTPQSIVENFSNNLNEWGDAGSGPDEPGVFSQTFLDDPLDPADDFVYWPIAAAQLPTALRPEYTLLATRDGCGQSTSANWNNGFRFFGLSNMPVNTDIDDGTGALKAVYQPWCGDGQDGEFVSSGAGTVYGLSTDQGGSIDGDGVYEYARFELKAGDTLNVTGSLPLVILCRGDFTLNGTINLQGAQGGPGLDTDDSPAWANTESVSPAGTGGDAGPGGGMGGMGGVPLGTSDGVGLAGDRYVTVFGNGAVLGGGGGTADPLGGGGGGLGTDGQPGTLTDGTPGANQGLQAGDAAFGRDITLFEPDRTYSPNVSGSGGTGGGGGGVNDADSSGGSSTGDDGGAGGGGAGGGMYVLAKGMLIVGGTVNAQGGQGGHTYAIEGQILDLGADGEVGGTGENADTILGVQPGALPSGAGGPGGGGSGGAIFLMGAAGVDVQPGASLDTTGGASGESGTPAFVGGAGSDGIVTVATMDGVVPTVTAGATIPAHNVVDYKPTVHNVSVGQSEWVDVFTPTAEFKVFRWTSNFAALQSAGLVQGTDFDAYIEVQGADSVSPLPQDGVPVSASNATEWTRLNLNLVSEDRVEYDGTASPIDGKRFFRYRWRFDVRDNWPVATDPLPQILSTTIEFER